MGQGVLLDPPDSSAEYQNFYLFIATFIQETAGMAFDLDQSDLERPLT